MGLALAIKPAARARFSVLSFGLAQIAMDVEPLLGMLRDWDVLHGWSHTFAGALCIGAAVALASPPLLNAMVRFLHAKASENGMAWFLDPEPLSRLAVWTGAMVGTISHVLMDALMHRDMQPFAPFSPANPLLGLVEHDNVYFLCAVLFGAGAAAWTLSRWRKQRAR